MSQICLLILYLIVAVNCSAQDFVYKHYDLQDGLANPTIHTIFQDKDGFLWFGTESGLCRYDGTHFTTFTTKDGLRGNDVFGLFQDSKGRIWLQQYKNTLAYIYNGIIYNETNDLLLRQIKLTNRVHGIAEDAHGNIGLCDNETFYIIDTANRITAIPPLKNNPLSLIGLSCDRKGSFIISASTSLCIVENNRLKQTKILSQEKNGMFGPNNVLLNPHYIAYSLNDNKITIHLADTTILITQTTGYILKYSPLSDSVFSINTMDGAWLFNTNNYSLVKILPGIKVTNTFIDRENNLWIGTLSKGLYKIGSRFIVNKPISDNQNDICYITKEDNNIVVANNNLNIYDYRNNQFTNRPHPFRTHLSLKIFYLEKRSSNTWLLAHGMGLLLCKKSSPKKFLYSIMLKHISQLHDGYLLMSAHAGVFVVRKSDITIVDTIWQRKSLCAFKTNDSVLIGTTAGLFILKKYNNRYKVVDSLLSNAIVGDIKATPQHTLWISTYENGLYCMQQGRITRYFNDSSELPSNNCRSLYVKDNTVWLGTDKGLVRITPDGNHFAVKKYGTSDGLPSNIINSIYIDSNMLYIGTPEGLCYFNEAMIETKSICNLVLTGVRIGDSLTNLTGSYTLHWKQPLSIEFSGISFRSEQEMTYRYKTIGMDDTWRKTNQHLLEFSSLPFGDYELVVIAINKFGKESKPLQISIHVQKPYYKATWFIVLMALLPAVLILFAYNRWKNHEKEQQLEKLQQEVKIMELEQMALRAQMNPHFIFNCISAMQHLVAENEAENTYKFINSFSNLVRQTLDNAPALFISLGEEIQFLTSYFELERIRLEDRFSYRIHTANIDNIHQLKVPNMVIQPFAENAIRHGVRYKKDGKGFIDLLFEQHQDVLRCTVTDNGIGREMAGNMRNASGQGHVSRGIGITFKRIESLNSLTHGNISIEIEDLKDGNGQALGTKVIIDFYKMNTAYDKNADNR